MFSRQKKGGLENAVGGSANVVTENSENSDITDGLDDAEVQGLDISEVSFDHTTEEKLGTKPVEETEQAELELIDTVEIKNDEPAFDRVTEKEKKMTVDHIYFISFIMFSFPCTWKVAS